MATKIINVLKDDSFDEIFDIFNQTSAKEVILVLPKKSKLFKNESDFIALSNEADRQHKTISLLCSNSEINQFARKYGFDVLIAGDQPGLISAVNQFEGKAKLEPKKSVKFEDLPPWGDRELPGLPVTETPIKKEKVSAKSKPRQKPKIEATVLSEEDLIDVESPNYEFQQAVKVRKLEDIIPPIQEDALNVKVDQKKEKSSRINIKSASTSEEDDKTELEEISTIWDKSDHDNRSSNIWNDWDFGSQISKLHKKSFKKDFKIPSVDFKRFKFKSRNLIFSIVAASVVLIGITIYITTGNAKIIISPKKQLLDLRIKTLISDKYTAVDSSLNKIPGQLFMAEKEITQKFNATGQKDAIQKARGIITVYNETALPQPLVATTRFESESKLVFRTLKSIVVPAAISRNSQTQPGVTRVEVIADKPGSEYNISGGRLTIVAFREKGDMDKFARIYGNLSGAMHGGISGKATVVTESDYNSAKEAIIKQLTQYLNDSIKIQVSQFKIIDSAGLTIRDPVSTAQIDDVATTFEMTIKASIKTLGFKEDDLYQIINSNIQKTNDLIVIPDKVEITYDKVKFSQITNTLEFEAVVKGNAYVKIDQDEIIDLLIGKKDREIREYLLENPDIESARVVLSPFWVRRLPSDLSKIKFELRY